MATYEKIKFSNGGATSSVLAIDDISNPVYTVHSTGTSSTVIDEVWLWITSKNGTSMEFEVQAGSALYYVGLVPAGTNSMLILPGVIMSGTGSAATNLDVGWLSFSIGTFDSVYAYGYVNRITP